MKNLKRVMCLLLATAMVLCTFVGCVDNGGPGGTVISNETTRLVLASAELEGVFNPFYSSSGADGTIIGMTQIGMLSSDKYGVVSYGKDEACVVLDMETVFVDENGNVVDENSGNIANTVYRFVLKNDLKFSNGSPLTMKDVLFNMYVYLDPAYYGSSTMYSTDIVGLQAYRTQSTNESEQDSFNEQFDVLAANRIQRFLECLEIVYDEADGSLTEESMRSALQAAVNMATELDPEYATVMADYELARQYFMEELQSDYNYARGTAQDIVFTDKSGKKVTLTTDTEAFLYTEGLIRWNEDEYKFEYSLGEDSKNWSEEKAIKAIYDNYIPNQVDVVITAWATAQKLMTYFSFLEKQKYFETLDSKIESVSGIRYANRTESITVNGVEYAAPELNADGSVKNANEHQVLEITINKVDPKAVSNFSFTVAPMYYYSNDEQIAKFDYEKNFGVEYGSIIFQDEVIKNPSKIGVPMGAGPYKATTRTGDGSNVTAGTFKADNVVYFERNENFMFPVKIKYINYQVVTTNLMLDTLYSGGVHFVEPACKQENIDSLKAKESEGFDSSFVMTNGYGYIGINAEKIPSLEVRRAIMHAINTQHAVNYYLGYSYSIYRPMTKASWAYPADDGGQQYYAFDETGAISEQLVKDAGFTKNADGIYEKDGHKCSYVFTIAGDTTDHPAYNSLKQAAEILNAHGFDIQVKTDINALSKLANGDLTVWAAAWGSAIDPDMYQVYHIDSTAGSTSNWGYRAIRKNAGGKYDRELAIVRDLSDIIDAARETLDKDRRIEYYAAALDLVMELAVELPTYQRSDLYAYNANIIDVSTLTPDEDLTPYNGPISKIWEIGLNETGN